METNCPLRYMTPGSKPKEECGVFGVWGPHLEISRTIYFGLFALQHRGQESAGMTISVGNTLTEYRDMGLVSQVFDDKILKILRGQGGIGHVRYSTTGSPVAMNAQPVFLEENNYQLGLGHNGNLVNTEELRDAYEQRGQIFSTSTDTEIIAKLITEEIRGSGGVEDAVLHCMRTLRGSYAVVMMVDGELYAFRDPLGSN